MPEIVGMLALGLFTGLIASTLGVGGGIVLVPSLVVFFSFAQLEAQGTSLAVIVPTAVASTYVHNKRGRVDWKVAGFVAIGGIAGGLIGSTFALSIDPDILRRLFAALLMVVAIRMLNS